MDDLFPRSHEGRIELRDLIIFDTLLLNVLDEVTLDPRSRIVEKDREDGTVLCSLEPFRMRIRVTWQLSVDGVGLGDPAG